MLLSQSSFDVVVLDVIMPEMSGIQVCRRIRSAPSICKILILFLTAKGRPNDIVEGLDAGADDYLVKPFAVVELPARVRALLRRGSDGVLNPDTNRLTLGGIVLDVNSLDIHVDNRMLSLTPIEHRLLHTLMMQAGQPISTDLLLESVWDYPPGVGDPRLVRVHITNLRAKLQTSPDDPPYIINLHGQGYMIARS
jgi:DNA-binding response OmpR family regulator